VEKVRVEPSLYSYMVTLIRRTRDWPAVDDWGRAHGAALGLFAGGSRDRWNGRPRFFLSLTTSNLPRPAVLRPTASYSSRKPELEGLTSDQVISELLATVEVPK